MHTSKLFLAITSALAFGALLSATVNPQGKGNEAKSRYYFRQTCKECHTKGAKGGEVTPLTKTMAQWRLYFVKGRHNGVGEGLEKIMTQLQNDLRDSLAAAGSL